jgi:hypothetical protein
MFLAIYFDIALLYVLVSIVVLLSLFSIAQLPCGIHAHETIYQRSVRFIRTTLLPRIIFTVKAIALPFKDPITPKSKSL